MAETLSVRRLRLAFWLSDGAWSCRLHLSRHMNSKTLALGAAILVAGFLLVTFIDGWLFGPVWMNRPGASFPIYALGGLIGVLVVTFVGRFRRKD